ncbi:MAG: hypothetical protein V1755_06010 [Chloroflexota bacterium]
MDVAGHDLNLWPQDNPSLDSFTALGVRDGCDRGLQNRRIGGEQFLHLAWPHLEAAWVLEEGGVVGTDAGVRRASTVMTIQQCLEPLVGRPDVAGFLGTLVTAAGIRRWELSCRRDVVPRSGDYESLDARRALGGLSGLIQARRHEHDLNTGIVHLMGDLTAGVERVCRHNDGTGLQDCVERHYKLRDVGH